MLETWLFIRKHTHICSFRKYTFKYQDLLNIVSIFFFFFKKSAFVKNSAFTQNNSMRAVLEIFWFCFQFL